MEKQLLIYSKVSPLSKEKHKNLSLEVGKDYSFAKEINSAPLTTVEFAHAAADFSIVFTGEDGGITPSVILGIKDGENAYIDEDGKMKSSYIPAFLRRYPFIFSTNDEGKQFTLCIDESFIGCNEEDRGQRLFDEEGEQTKYLKKTLTFLQDYQSHFNRTRAFCAMLKELDLLSPMEAAVSPKGGSRSKIVGFQAINREKLEALPDEEILKLVKSGGMELIYLHLNSLRNFSAIANRMIEGKIYIATKEVETAEVH